MEIDSFQKVIDIENKDICSQILELVTEMAVLGWDTKDLAIFLSKDLYDVVIKLVSLMTDSTGVASNLSVFGVPIALSPKLTGTTAVIINY